MAVGSNFGIQFNHGQWLIKYRASAIRMEASTGEIDLARVMN
jgi:hypothetical protein